MVAPEAGSDSRSTVAPCSGGIAAMGEAGALIKRPKTTEGVPTGNTPIDVDALVDEVLSGTVEDFTLQSLGDRSATATPSERHRQEAALGGDGDYDNFYAEGSDHGARGLGAGAASHGGEPYLGGEEAFGSYFESDAVSLAEAGEEGGGGLLPEPLIVEGSGGDEYGHEGDSFISEGELAEYSHFVSGSSDAYEHDLLPGVGGEGRHGEAELLLSADGVVAEIRRVGPVAFTEGAIEVGQTPEAVMDLLGFVIPEGLLHVDDEGRWAFVRRILFKYVYERPRIASLSTLDDAVAAIRAATRIVIVTGAGISVSTGIPDFRSADGLYARIQGQYGLPEPECMFDIDFFRTDPEPFYAFAREILPSAAVAPSFSHYFIKGLEQRQKLLRNYTQNIDTLEQAAAIERVLYCHGSFATASCLECAAAVSFERLRRAIAEETVPLCKECGGIVKPDIVFFGEPLPAAFDEALAEDRTAADLLIVIGSSLKVHPVSTIPDVVPPGTPQILINRESLDHTFDVELLGDCDLILAEIARRLSWEAASFAPRFGPLLAQAVEGEALAPNMHIFPGAIVPPAGSCRQAGPQRRRHGSPWDSSDESCSEASSLLDGDSFLLDSESGEASDAHIADDGAIALDAFGGDLHHHMSTIPLPDVAAAEVYLPDVSPGDEEAAITALRGRGEGPRASSSDEESPAYIK